MVTTIWRRCYEDPVVSTPMISQSTMTRRGFLKAAACAAIVATNGCRIRRVSGPNVILIYADDLGYGDLGCYGSTTISTPNLDRLAEEGIRLTDYRSTCSVCSPSRASLLTGRYPSRCGVPFAVGGVYSDLGLQDSEVTIAELLQAHGYRTACIGKWHLGFPQGFDYRTHAGFTSASEFHPRRHGFDLYYGMAGNTHPDGSTALLENDGILDPDAHVTTITEHFTHRAAAFIESDPSHPFFLYLPHTRSHAPWMSNPRFAGQSLGGVYGDMVEELDWSTGVLLEALERSGQTSNTVVVFSSDNGASQSPIYGSNGSLRGGKGTTFEGGMRVPCIIRWPEHIKAGQVSNVMMNAMDFLPTIAAMAGVRLPTDRVLDGIDMTALLSGTSGAEEGERVFYYYNGLNLQAVREGRWKLHLPRSAAMLVWWESGLRELDAPLLYDLETDPGESTDVAARHPDVVRRLLAEATHARGELGSWERPGSDQQPIEHLLDDRRRLRHLRTQQNHQILGLDVPRD